MRIRATVAAVSGALVLTALAVPAAQAATSTTAATLNVTFSHMKVNKGKAIVLGTSSKVSVPVTYTVTHPAGLNTSPDNFATGALIYRGASVTKATGMEFSDEPATCKAASSTTLTCSGLLAVYREDLANSEAGTWTAGAIAVTKNHDSKIQGDLGGVKVQRAARLTADATPEPVKKGRTLTVTGRLTRADWEKGTYAGFGSQYVKLQFRKKGSTAYTTVKTVKATSTGALKTTVTASADGYYRYSFAGTTTTSGVNSAADFVDVR
jgi:hypothetical protein